MKRIHVPAGGLHYWVALCLASILGCNTGDLFASFFGFLSGLPILLALFGICLLVERRDDRPRQAYYWLAIIVIRTAATNLADFTSQSMRGTAMGLLALLLLAALVARPVISWMSSSDRRPGAGVLDRVDRLYWTTMLLAGTLGTALGDFSSFRLGLGLAGASMVLSVLVAILIGLGSVRLFAFTLYYWFVVVAIRTAGTSVGDYFARVWGLHESTLVFAVLLIGLLALWRERSRSAQPTLQAGVVIS